MSEYPPLCDPSKVADSNELAEEDDIQNVLVTLQRLARATNHPIVRACLEETHDED